MSGAKPDRGHVAGSPPDLGRCQSRSGAGASRRTSARAMAGLRAGFSIRCGCGGDPTACRGRQRSCRFAVSARARAGARTQTTVAITGRYGSRLGQWPTASRAPMRSTILSSRSTTICARGSRAAGAPCSSMSRGRASSQRPAASHSPPPPCAGYSSDAAFAKAFKRRFGSAPGRYRARASDPPQVELEALSLNSR